MKRFFSIAAVFFLTVYVTYPCTNLLQPLFLILPIHTTSTVSFIIGKQHNTVPELC